MPLVRIDLVTGRTPEAVRGIADAIHTAIVDVYGIPPRDRFQIITEHPAQQIIAEDAGLGFERTDGVVMIQVFTQRGRSDDAKQQLYAAIHDALAVVGVGIGGRLHRLRRERPRGLVVRVRARPVRHRRARGARLGVTAVSTDAA